MDEGEEEEVDEVEVVEPSFRRKGIGWDMAGTLGFGGVVGGW